MSALADAGSRAGTLVAAAMQTAGARMQSDMLDLLNKPEGQILAGLFFLLAIIGAVITVAMGGSYKWSRYLLLGPALFFFLTQVRTASNGTEWQLADRRFPKEAIDKAIEGVADFEGGAKGGSDVALFFKFWDTLVSEGVQYLIGLLNLKKSDADLNFVRKIERYMNFKVFPKIENRETKIFVQLALINECAEYYFLQLDIAAQGRVDLLAMQQKERLAELQNKAVFHLEANATDDLSLWLLRGGPKSDDSAKLEPGTYTCGQLWDAAIKLLAPEAKMKLYSEINFNPAPLETEQSRMDTLMDQVQKSLNEASGLIDLQQRYHDEKGRFQAAVDEYIARALFKEMLDSNRYSAYVSMEKHNGAYRVGVVAGGHYGEAGEGPVIGEISKSIKSFNQTQKYQFKGDFVNGALAMPYFQGVLLLLLSVAYPFAAMMLLVPARMGSFFGWMGLWLWVKSWDLGFAVVMLIDNMLYSMFPRGPGLSPGDLSKPGIAWVKILEQDPTYSAHTYYNLIATCLYAVPLVMALLLKKGAGELGGISHKAWTGYASRLGQNTMQFVQSNQARSTNAALNLGATEIGRMAWNKAMESQYVKDHLADMRRTYLLSNAMRQAESEGRKLLGFGDKNQGAKLTEMLNPAMESMRNYHMNCIASYMKAEYESAIWGAYTGAWGQYMNEEMVGSRFSTNPVIPKDHPDAARMDAALASHYLDSESVVKSFQDAALAEFGTAGGFKQAKQEAKDVGGAWGKAEKKFRGGPSGP